VQAGTKLVTAVMGASPLAPAAPLFNVIGNLVAGWAAEKERDEKAQPYLTAAQRLALEWADYNACMEVWPQADRLYDAGAYAGAEAMYKAARAKGREARLAVAAQLDRLNVEGYRRWMQAKENEPGLLDGLDGDGDGRDAVLYRGWRQGLAGITGRPVFLLKAVDNRKQEGRWAYKSAVDGLTRVYHWQPGHAQYHGEVVEERPLSPEALARLVKAREERAQRPILEEQLGVAPGENVRERKLPGGRGQADVIGEVEMPDKGDVPAAPRQPRAPPVIVKTAPEPVPAPPVVVNRPAFVSPITVKAPAPRRLVALPPDGEPPTGKGQWLSSSNTEVV
jgi:hypothetical protein